MKFGRWWRRRVRPHLFPGRATKQGRAVRSKKAGAEPEVPPQVAAFAPANPTSEAAQGPMLQRLGSWAEVERVFDAGKKCGSEPERIELLCKYYFDAGGIAEGLDPFSSAYLDQVLKLYATITGQQRYDAAHNELAPYLANQSVNFLSAPPPYRVGSTDFLGEFLVSWGFILKTLALKPGQKLLEYGPGSGNLAIMAARNGCDVTVVDVERSYIDGIKRQCDALEIPIKAHVGEFGSVPDPNERFDAVLFFEAFHHALRHNDLLCDLHNIAADDGVIAFAGEPIIAAGDFWEPLVPFPWGPRCDLLSLWAMHTYGWMELGFRESYFTEALARAGWQVAKHVCPITFRGNTFVARRSGA